MFRLVCVELLPLPKGFETCHLQVILLFAFPLVFDRLLESLLVISFLFLLSLVTKTCVLLMHSSRGRLRACVVRELVVGRFLL
jgi:hypothetical protein